MCKHSFGTVNEAKLRAYEREAWMPNWSLYRDVVQVHPWMLCEIIPDFEGQKHVYTELSISSIWPCWIIRSVKIKSLLDISEFKH